MKKIILSLIVTIPLLISAQTKVGDNHANTPGLKCLTCHSCPIPTKENLCLKPCPREGMIRIDQKPEDGPKVIIIDKFKKQSDLYMPVRFSHLAHAEMSEMGGGCRMCHHYNPPGNVIGCSECHEVSRKRADVSKPDLKGAYHRHCMDCHRAWTGGTDCNYCHLPNGTNRPLPEKPKADESKKRIHPKVETPEKILFSTNTSYGKTVLFRHQEHNKVFGFDCSDCHSNESCVKCHKAQKTIEVSKLSTADKHKKCSECHDTKSSCNMCHSNKETSAFDHMAKTGFDNSKFHANLACIRCHTTKGTFTGLTTDCSSCHGIWTQSNFNHKITGVVLDETHSGAECKDCHQEKNFAKPVCTNCHDDKSFPANVPGKLVPKGWIPIKKNK